SLCACAQNCKHLRICQLSVVNKKLLFGIFNECSQLFSCIRRTDYKIVVFRFVRLSFCVCLEKTNSFIYNVLVCGYNSKAAAMCSVQESIIKPEQVKSNPVYYDKFIMITQEIVRSSCNGYSFS